MSRKISYQALTLLTARILEKYGYSKKEPELTAWVLVEADARGVPSRGVSRLAFYRMNRDKGFSKPGANPSIIWETPVSLVVDEWAAMSLILPLSRRLPRQKKWGPLFVR